MTFARTSKISHYLAPQIYKSIFSGQRDVTISEAKSSPFSFRYQGFHLHHRAPAPEITLLLNEYFTEMSAIALIMAAPSIKPTGDAPGSSSATRKGTVEDASLPQHGDGDAAPAGRAQCQMA
jgi:hypothetical protein